MEIREAAGAYRFRFSGLVIEGGLHDDSLVRELAERGGGAITERVNRLQGPKMLVLVAQEQSCAAVARRFPSDAHLDVEDWRIFVAEDVCLAGQWPAGPSVVERVKAPSLIQSKASVKSVRSHSAHPEFPK